MQIAVQMRTARPSFNDKVLSVRNTLPNAFANKNSKLSSTSESARSEDATGSFMQTLHKCVPRRDSIELLPKAELQLRCCAAAAVCLLTAVVLLERKEDKSRAIDKRSGRHLLRDGGDAPQGEKKTRKTKKTMQHRSTHFEPRIREFR